MLTAGPEDLEVMPFCDWAVLIEYAEKHTKIPAVVLRTLVIDPVSVDPRDLADELDHLWDTKPPEPIALVIAGVLESLGEQGVGLSEREDKKLKISRMRRSDPETKETPMRPKVSLSPRLYVYKLTTDNGGAPCIRRGVLSLAICKPNIRRTAQEGSWIFGFGGKVLRKRLIYIARVTRRVEDGSYYVDDAYKGRDDRIYRCDRGKFAVRNGAKYHSDGSRLEHDLGKPPGYARAVTLLSDNFRYWGKKGTADYRRQYPAVATLLKKLTQGFRVNLSLAERRELVDLQCSQWKAHPNTKVLGPPSEGDLKKVCNRSEGTVGSSRVRR